MPSLRCATLVLTQLRCCIGKGELRLTEYCSRYEVATALAPAVTSVLDVAGGSSRAAYPRSSFTAHHRPQAADVRLPVRQCDNA